MYLFDYDYAQKLVLVQMDEDNSVEVRLQEALLEVEDVRAERDQAESLAAALFKIVTGRQEMTVDEQLTEVRCVSIGLL